MLSRIQIQKLKQEVAGEAGYVMVRWGMFSSGGGGMGAALRKGPWQQRRCNRERARLTRDWLEVLPVSRQEDSH